jgi:hypothetical protein
MKTKTKKQRFADVKKQIRKTWDIRRVSSLTTAYYEDQLFLQQEAARMSLEIDRMF